MALLKDGTRVYGGLFVNSALTVDSGGSTFVTANTSGVYPVSNTSGSTLGSTTQRWVVSANTIDASGLIAMTSYRETANTPTISAGSLTLNLSLASVFTVALNGNVTSLTISNPASSGNVSSFTLVFTADGTARSVTWPASVKWPAGTAPTLTSTNGKKDVFTFFTTDGGTTYNAFVSGQNL